MYRTAKKYIKLFIKKLNPGNMFRQEMILSMIKMTKDFPKCLLRYPQDVKSKFVFCAFHGPG